MSDYTGGYDLTFIVAGAIMVLSGIMLFAIPCLRRYEKQNREGCDSEHRNTQSEQSCKTDQDQCNMAVSV